MQVYAFTHTYLQGIFTAISFLPTDLSHSDMAQILENEHGIIYLTNIYI